MTDSQQDYKFEGWGAFGKDSIKGNLEWFEYEPKKFDEGDIDSEFGPRHSELTRKSRFNTVVSADPIFTPCRQAGVRSIILRWLVTKLSARWSASAQKLKTSR